MRSEEEIRKKRNILKEVLECKDMRELYEFTAPTAIKILDWVLEERGKEKMENEE